MSNIAILALCAMLSVNPTIYIAGDSRTVAMEAVVNDGDVNFIAECGAGYDHLRDLAVPYICSNASKDDIVVLQYGVNDTYHAVEYVREANKLSDNGYCVYFVSVNPVIDEKSRYVKNEDIDKFNEYVKTHLSENVRWIETNAAIRSSFKSTDGIHYTDETTEEIYRIIQKTVGLPRSTVMIGKNYYYVED